MHADHSIVPIPLREIGSLMMTCASGATRTTAPHQISICSILTMMIIEAYNVPIE